MNIFIEKNYRTALRKKIEERQLCDPKLNFQRVAEETRIPKSYISKVMTGKADLSQDQLFCICEYLKLPENEQSYLSLLLEAERSANKARRDKILKQAAILRESEQDSTKHLQAGKSVVREEMLSKFYLDPLNQLVHIALSLERLQGNVALISKELQIGQAELTECLGCLLELGMIEKKGERLTTVVKNIHLPKNSASYRPWTNQLKLLCAERLHHRSRPKDYSFSATFSATESTREQIKADFLSFLRRTEATVNASKHEEVFQMNFDLFPWTSANQAGA